MDRHAKNFFAVSLHFPLISALPGSKFYLNAENWWLFSLGNLLSILNRGNYFMCPFFNPYFNQKNYDSLLTVPLGPEAHLEFDGERLYWVDGENSVSWPAYSGAMNLLIYKNFSVEAQKLKNMGPIPEGVYHVRRRNYQKYNKTLDELNREHRNRTRWPGGTNAWGEHRIWLEKDENTETWGRDGFSIHGGRVPGSAGCIDLTEHMPEFVEKFLRYGRPMRLEVRYKKK